MRVRTKKSKKSFNKSEARAINNLDDLRAYEQFCAQILPSLRKDLLAGMDTDELLKKWKSVAAARLLTEAANPHNNSIGLAAARDILDRASGKAVERRQIEHRLGKLPEAELDALLMTSMEDAADANSESEAEGE